jgi:dihydrofolate reductase
MGTSPVLSILVAVSDNGVIGREGRLPWHLPDDLKRFKALTMGKPIVMGRRTFESIGRPLPGRVNLVLTHSPDWQADGVVVVHSLDEAIERSRFAQIPTARDHGAREVCVIGGAAVFDLALSLASIIHLTRVRARIDGDTFFPPLDQETWRETERVEHPADERHAYAMSFCTLERARPLHE